MGKDLRNVEMFPEYIIELQKELIHHPDIRAQMVAAWSFETNIAAICTAMNILVDGMYDVEDLCNMLIKKLKEKRTIHIFTKAPE